MSEFINESADIFNEEKKKTPIFLLILKWFCIGIILLVFGILAFRCSTHRDHSITDKVLMNEAFYKAYEQSPDELKVRKYGIPSPWIDVAQGRIIEFDELYHIPLLNQLQLSVKYNEDIIPKGFDNYPPKFRLIDENGNEFENYFYETGKIERFCHVRVCFENIAIDTGEVDENGNELRHSYTLAIDIVNDDGSYKELCRFPLYNGESDKSAVYKDIDYKV